MSGILLPFVHPTSADLVGAATPVPVDLISHIVSENPPASGPILNPSNPSSTAGRYLIRFLLKSATSREKEITWSFSVEASRDTTYSNLLTLLSDAVA